MDETRVEQLEKQLRQTRSILFATLFGLFVAMSGLLYGFTLLNDAMDLILATQEDVERLTNSRTSL